jgi:hypothetical protein
MDKSYLLAFLLKQVLRFHKKEVYITWGRNALTIVNREIRLIPEKPVGKAGLVWSDIKKHGFDTAQIYIIIVQAALLATEKGELYFYTPEYENLIKEFLTVIEKNIDVAEWEKMQAAADYIGGLEL